MVTNLIDPSRYLTRIIYRLIGWLLFLLSSITEPKEGNKRIMVAADRGPHPREVDVDVDNVEFRIVQRP